jgi:hypothetical protein
MPIAELDHDDDEDWHDDSDDVDEEWGPCPECGETVFLITGKCPACGYWLSADDRRTMFASQAKPLWLKLTALVLLLAMLAGMIGVVVGVF